MSFRLPRQIEHEYRTRYFVNMNVPVPEITVCTDCNWRVTRALARVCVEAPMTSQKKTLDAPPGREGDVFFLLAQQDRRWSRFCSAFAVQSTDLHPDTDGFLTGRVLSTSPSSLEEVWSRLKLDEIALDVKRSLCIVYMWVRPSVCGGWNCTEEIVGKTVAPSVMEIFFLNSFACFSALISSAYFRGYSGPYGKNSFSWERG